MNEDVKLVAWAWPRDLKPGVMAVVALDKLLPSDLELLLHSSTGDTITARTTVSGAAEVQPDDVVYVGGRGAFEVVRREGWPNNQVLLTLAAWPHR